MTADPQIRVPRRPPAVLLADPPPPIDIKGVRFSILPARAVQDPRLNGRPHLLLLLAAVCLHSDPLGRCWPSQGRLAKLCGRSPPWVSRYIRELEAYGYLVRVKSRSKNWKHAIRRVVVYEPGAPLPPLEVPEPMPWATQFHQPTKGPHMRDTFLSEIRKAKTTEEVAAIHRAEQSMYTLAEYYSRQLSKLHKMRSNSDANLATARAWLQIVDINDALRHVDALMAAYADSGKVPSTKLSDMPEPQVTEGKSGG